jgi:SAM-dependent methyltransferase
VRRQSFEALMNLLAREAPGAGGGAAADLGAGTGWLSVRLAQAGYAVLAVEASLDQDFGLGAILAHCPPAVEVQLVQGDLEHLPIQYGKLGLAVLNASLHYARDLGGTLRGVAGCLRRGGRLIVLDTPIARRPRPGTGEGDRHLGREELHQGLIEAGLAPRWIRVRRGLTWTRRQVAAWLRRTPRFSFPVVVANRILYVAQTASAGCQFSW